MPVFTLTFDSNIFGPRQQVIEKFLRGEIVFYDACTQLGLKPDELALELAMAVRNGVTRAHGCALKERKPIRVEDEDEFVVADGMALGAVKGSNNLRIVVTEGTDKATARQKAIEIPNAWLYTDLGMLNFARVNCPAVETKPKAKAQATLRA